MQAERGITTPAIATITDGTSATIKIINDTSTIVTQLWEPKHYARDPLQWPIEILIEVPSALVYPVTTNST
jgi:hypothetical protein